MTDVNVDVLEQKIETLEKRLIGNANKDASYPKVSQEMVDTLAGFKKQLTTATADRKKIQPVLKKLGELNEFLDPAYAETLTLSNEAKTEIILAEEDFIRETAAQLEMVKDSADVLGSEHIKVVPALEKKLQELSKIHIQQQDKSCELSDEVKNLLLQYNNIITTLSKQFLQWDEIVTRLEIARQPKQPLD